MNVRYLMALLLVLAVVAVPAGADGIGTSGVPFLRINPMARPVAMGNAYTGLASGIEALTYNPAGLTTVDKWDLALSQTIYTLDLRYSYAAAARRLSDKSVVAVSLTYLGTDDVERDANGNIVGRFSSYDIAPAVTVAYQIAPEVAAGGTLRFIRSEIYNYDANAVGFDFGVTYRPIDWPGVSIGAAVKNLGTGVEYIATSSPQPLSIRTGIAYSPPRGSYTVSGDISMDREKQPRAHIGAEYRLFENLAARCGFDVGNDATFERALKLGMGFYSKVGSFDYAFESMGDAGNKHMFSYSYLGGQPHLYDRTDTRGFFARGSNAPRTKVKVALPSFSNLSPGTEYDWLSEGLREIFLMRMKRNDELVFVPYTQADYLLEGKFSALNANEIWIGVRIISLKDRMAVGFKEATVTQDGVLDGAAILAGTVITAIPGR